MPILLHHLLQFPPLFRSTKTRNEQRVLSLMWLGAAGGDAGGKTQTKHMLLRYLGDG